MQFASGWAFAPSFHYSELRSRTGNDEQLGEIETATSMYRYGVDAQYFLPGRNRAWRPFLTGGFAVVRNRLREADREGQFFAESCNAVAVAAGAGLRTGTVEITAQYEVNRFTTNRFWRSVRHRLQLGYALGAGGNRASPILLTRAVRESSRTAGSRWTRSRHRPEAMPASSLRGVDGA